MRTKTWSFERTIFPRRFGQNGRGAKGRSQSQRQFEPGAKAMLKVETMRQIVHGLLEISKHIYDFI